MKGDSDVVLSSRSSNLKFVISAPDQYWVKTRSISDQFVCIWNSVVVKRSRSGTWAWRSSWRLLFLCDWSAPSRSFLFLASSVSLSLLDPCPVAYPCRTLLQATELRAFGRASIHHTIIKLNASSRSGNASPTCLHWVQSVWTYSYVYSLLYTWPAKPLEGALDFENSTVDY